MRKILDIGRDEGSVVVTLDADFHALLVLSGAAGPSVIRIRIEGLRAEDLSTLLIKVIEVCNDDLTRGTYEIKFIDQRDTEDDHAPARCRAVPSLIAALNGMPPDGPPIKLWSPRGLGRLRFGLFRGKEMRSLENYSPPTHVHTSEEVDDDVLHFMGR